jgi:predicted secreted Zn-dependent protease
MSQSCVVSVRLVERKNRTPALSHTRCLLSFISTSNCQKSKEKIENAQMKIIEEHKDDKASKTFLKKILFA